MIAPVAMVTRALVLAVVCAKTVSFVNCANCLQCVEHIRSVNKKTPSTKDFSGANMDCSENTRIQFGCTSNTITSVKHQPR